MVTDPLTQVYDAIWTLLAAGEDFAGAVKEGNRITFTGKARNPEKSNVMDADFPEVRLQPLGGEYGPVRDTGGRTWIERYQITLCTGDRRLDDRLYPVRWAIVRALAEWETTLKALTWEDDSFVLNLELQTVNVGTSEVDMKRSIEGWASVATLEVTMWFPHTNLRGT